MKELFKQFGNLLNNARAVFDAEAPKLEPVQNEEADKSMDVVSIPGATNEIDIAVKKTEKEGEKTIKMDPLYIKGERGQYFVEDKATGELTQAKFELMDDESKAILKNQLQMSFEPMETANADAKDGVVSIEPISEKEIASLKAQQFTEESMAKITQKDIDQALAESGVIKSEQDIKH